MRVKIARCFVAGLSAAVVCCVLRSAPASAQEPDYTEVIRASPGYDKLTKRPMWVEKIADGLFVIRGPITIDDGTPRPPDVIVPPPRPNSAPPANVVQTQATGRPRIPDMLPHEPSDSIVRVTPDGLILVDAKFTYNAQELWDTIKTISPLPVKYLINTHYHADHTGGTAFMLAHGAQLISQENMRRDYEKTKLGGASPEVSFGNYGSIYLGGVKVEMYHFGNAHTDGDTMVYFPDLRALALGDVVIDGMPHFDYRGGGGSALGHVTSINNLLQLDFAVAIPGHGRLLTKQYVRNYLNDVETLNSRMKALVRSGIPKDIDAISKALKMDDLVTASPGIFWNHSVSTSNTMTNDLPGYYDEMAAVIAAEKDDQPSVLEPRGFMRPFNMIVNIPPR